MDDLPGGEPPHAILLFDESLSIEIYYECDDCDYDDNIIIRIREDCPDEERLFRGEETHLFITRDQAISLIDALSAAVRASREDLSPGDQG